MCSDWVMPLLLNSVAALAAGEPDGGGGVDMCGVLVMVRYTKQSGAPRGSCRGRGEGYTQDEFRRFPKTYLPTPHRTPPTPPLCNL